MLKCGALGRASSGTGQLQVFGELQPQTASRGACRVPPRATFLLGMLPVAGTMRTAFGDSAGLPAAAPGERFLPAERFCPA